MVSTASSINFSVSSGVSAGTTGVIDAVSCSAAAVVATAAVDDCTGSCTVVVGDGTIVGGVEVSVSVKEGIPLYLFLCNGGFGNCVLFVSSVCGCVSDIVFFTCLF